MSRQRQNIYGTPAPGGTKAFLFSKSEGPPPADPGDRPPVGLQTLTATFPRLLTGKSFIENALQQIETFLQFGVLLVRIDHFSDLESRLGEAYATDLLVDTARAVDAVCRDEKGMWGLIERDLFGCFFPEQDESFCLHLADEIRDVLAGLRKETLTVGATEYPLIQFSRRQTVNNARKALDHAAFFSPSGSAAFNAVSLNISGDKRYQQGDVNGAIQDFQTALILDPSSFNVRNSLGVCYATLGATALALEEFQVASRLEPDEIMPVYNMGLTHMTAGDQDQALAHFCRAFEMDETFHDAAFQAGRLCLEMKNPAAARGWFETAARLKPSSGAAYRFLGEAYATLDRMDDAARAYRQAVKLNPDDAAAISALGCVYDLQGENPEIAILFCRHSVEISPENGLYRQRLGRLYMKHSRIDEAIAQFEKATERGCDSRHYIEQLQLSHAPAWHRVS